MPVEVRDARFHDIVGEEAGELETLADRFSFTEGPVWHPYDKHLIFSDIPTSTAHRYDPADGTLVQCATARTRETATPMTRTAGC